MAQIAEKTVARQDEADAERLYDQLNMEEGRLAELRYSRSDFGSLSHPGGTEPSAPAS